MKRILLASALALASISSCVRAADAPLAIGSKEYIVVIDLSASRTPAILAEAQQYLDRLVQRLSFGDSFVILQMQQDGLQGSPKRWQTTMPLPKDASFINSRDREHLAAAAKGIVYALPSYFKSADSGRILHTDIFTTMIVAGEFANEAGGKHTFMILLSDMLQSAKGIEMEHASRMPSSNWVDTQKRAGLIPSLRGTCVVVVGADATNMEGVKVRNFWQSYFNAAGAQLPLRNYRATPPSTDPGCS